MKYFFIPLLVITNITNAQNTPKNLDNKVAEVKEKVVNWRRDFHEHPELSNREFNTSKKVQAHLNSLGIETRIIAKTGVVGVLRGSKPGPDYFDTRKNT